jgi:hypothetical protein
MKTTIILKRDSDDSEMYHVYKREAWKKVVGGTNSVKTHVFCIYEDFLRVFGVEFAEKVAEGLVPGEEMTINIAAEKVQ